MTLLLFFIFYFLLLMVTLSFLIDILTLGRAL